jgi:putative sterol carrier protein
MTARKGDGDAAVTTTVSIDDWRDAVLNRNGASLVVLIPQQRPGRPDNTPRVKILKGTMALELSRDGDPFKVEVCFNGAAAPRTVMRVKLADYVDIQIGKLNGQEAFMTGKLKVEGDLAFMMQIAALTA